VPPRAPIRKVEGNNLLYPRYDYINY